MKYSSPTIKTTVSDSDTEKQDDADPDESEELQEIADQSMAVQIFTKAPMELATDSRGLFNLISSTKNPEEALNRAELASMREAFPIKTSSH